MKKSILVMLLLSFFDVIFAGNAWCVNVANGREAMSYCGVEWVECASADKGCLRLASCTSPSGLCWFNTLSYPFIFNPLTFEGCSLGPAHQNWCNDLTEGQRALVGCSTEPSPEQACANMKSHFDPPPESCEFEVEYEWVCRDGEGRVIEASYRLKSSDGRVTPVLETGRSAADEGVVCQPEMKLCADPEGCWDTIESEDEIVGGAPPVPTEECQKHVTINGDESVIVDVCGEEGAPIETDYGDGWYDRCVYRDENGVMRFKEECKTSEQNNNDDCIYQDENGVWKEKENCTSSGGGTPGTGGGTPGGGTGGGGTGDGGGTGGGGTPGTGGDGEGEGFDGNFGSSGDAENAVNEGGWGDGNGGYSVERGQGEHKNYLDGLMDKGPVQEIKNHDYVQTSGASCSMNVVLFNRNFTFSLCEYEDKIRLFGRLIFSIAGLCGVLLVLRR